MHDSYGYEKLLEHKKLELELEARENEWGYREKLIRKKLIKRVAMAVILLVTFTLGLR